MGGLQSLENLYFANNKISSIPDGAFESLVSVEHLDLSRNSITTVRSGMWTGLHLLQFLNLIHNKISNIPEHGFGGLTALDELALNTNELNTLASNVFDPFDFPDSGGHPPKLMLYLRFNPLQCDQNMCWLKEAK